MEHSSRSEEFDTERSIPTGDSIQFHEGLSEQTGSSELSVGDRVLVGGCG